MRLDVNKKASRRLSVRKKNKLRIRRKVEGSAERPRLVVFRSLKHIYAQVVDDVKGATLVATSTLKLDKVSSNCKGAEQVGKQVAEQAKKQGIQRVVFDRGGYVYHGRIKALAEGARAAGLEF